MRTHTHTHTGACGDVGMEVGLQLEVWVGSNSQLHCSGHCVVDPVGSGPSLSHGNVSSVKVSSRSGAPCSLEALSEGESMGMGVWCGGMPRRRAEGRGGEG